MCVCVLLALAARLAGCSELSAGDHELSSSPSERSRPPAPPSGHGPPRCPLAGNGSVSAGRLDKTLAHVASRCPESRLQPEQETETAS